jgi:hypothetical protein
MVLLIYLGCLVPFGLGLIWPRMRPSLVYVLLAVLFVWAMIPIHGALNDRPDSDGIYRRGAYSFRVTRHRIETISGPFSWRFFDWGLVHGDGKNTRFKFFLLDTFDVDYRTAQRLDVSNPTPCVVFLFLLVLAGIFPIVRRIVRGPRVTALPAPPRHGAGPAVASREPPPLPGRPTEAPGEAPTADPGRIECAACNQTFIGTPKEGNRCPLCGADLAP